MVANARKITSPTKRVYHAEKARPVSHQDKALLTRAIGSGTTLAPRSGGSPKHAPLTKASAAHAKREAALDQLSSTQLLHADAAEQQETLLTAEEEWALGVRIQAGGADGLVARDALVTANVRLVGKLARYYTGQRRGAVGAELDDLMQEGMIGLVRAAEKFDPTRGHRFSTSAVWWIRQAISRAMIDRSFTIRVPAYLRQRQARLTRLRAQIEAQTGEIPTVEMLATLAKCSVEQAQEALTISGDPISLDAQVRSMVSNRTGEILSLADIVDDPRASDAFAQTERSMDAITDASAPDSVQSIMRRLASANPAHARALRIVWRRVMNDNLTLEDIAAEMGITRERVRQLEAAGYDLVRRERERLRKQQQHQGACDPQRPTGGEAA